MRVVSILLLGLLALPAFTSELDRLQETLECSTERNWEAYQCPQYNPNIQNYFILTDGSNSFTPIGMCMTKILETPTRDDFAKYCSNLIYKSPAALSDNIIDLCAKIALNREQEADRRNNLNLLFAFNKIIYKNLSRNSDLYLNNKNAWGYFHYKHWKKASECIRSLKQEAKAAKQPITFHLIGYSMGGGSIIKTFIDVCHEVSVSQIITLDPFRMNAGSLETMT